MLNGIGEGILHSAAEQGGALRVDNGRGVNEDDLRITCGSSGPLDVEVRLG